MEKYYKINEVLEMLSISRGTIYKWEKEGKINITRINGEPRIAESEIRRITKGE